MKDMLLIDSDVLLDVITDDPVWGDRSSKTLIEAHAGHRLAINPVIYAEVAVKFTTAEELEEALPPGFFEKLPVPYEAAFLAGKCHMKYMERGGAKANALRDFLIGAHASVSDMKLVTRGVSRYSEYFPDLEMIAPQ
jgi:predicted nucleic acid-binding protein